MTTKIVGRRKHGKRKPIPFLLDSARGAYEDASTREGERTSRSTPKREAGRSHLHRPLNRPMVVAEAKEVRPAPPRPAALLHGLLRLCSFSFLERGRVEAPTSILVREDRAQLL